MMNKLSLFGLLLAVLGAIFLVLPGFSTQETHDVAQIGGLTVQARESTSYTIPSMVSGTVLVLGLVLIGVGLYRRQ
ncbi:MAG: hypothetical protein FD176_554 [Rhodospirillaceae bacterium]|nr:MAG: hypothetical protein FD176_554 [Rhodospirillaceae bacterium]TNC94936.1 MAG: hypothetical protein FD119_2723 [Stygiobacter sp.]